MKQLLSTWLTSIGIMALVFSIVPQPEVRENGGDELEEIQARQEWERIRLCDPRTGKIPSHMRERELEFAKSLPERSLGSEKANGVQSNSFNAVGPYNVGGRTRAIGIDVANENVLIAGSVSGGIWKSTDGGQTWLKKTPSDVMMDVTTVVQDTRSGKTNTWYAGTGEFYGASAEISGSGVYKSTDNGETWFSLASTYGKTPQTWDNTFEYVWRLAIDAHNTTQDVIYAATTLGSIQRSSDGGTTWATVLGTFSNGYSYFTDVAVSPSGVVYATFSQISSNNSTSIVRGMYRSTNGIQWTNITPPNMPTKYGRIAIGIAPSDENNVYFIANTPGSGFRQVDFRGREDWNSLWKYNYISGDGSGAGGGWDDRTLNLPRFGGTFGDFQSQGGYDLLVKVHPTKPNVVFVGGTNLCRSDDGFTTPTWTWIGGYGPGSTLPFYEVYPNNHPDHHDLVFYPSNPDHAISTCDGGIFRTDNVRNGTVVWNSLNNGYRTTQFYTCAIEHHKVSNVIVGGLQDNGTVFTNSSSPTKPWTSPGRGDGSYCAIASDGNYYMSSQQGSMARFDLDTDGTVKRYSRIDPAGTVRDSFLFVNPFVLDPNDQKRLYVPYRHSIFRCIDATLSPWGKWETTGSTAGGWDTLPVPTNQEVVSAIAISTQPANRLYYGTQTGQLYRVDDANGAVVTKKAIKGPTFPGANIECICVNPHNADSVLVVFSNYNVQSMFFSADGGTTWSAVGGNLEGAIDGIGNGPSCRWAKFCWVQGKCLTLVGTSVGLFSTALLNGPSTVWVREAASSVGSNIVTMIEYREQDNFVAIATHGNGMFSGILNSLPPPPDAPVLESPADGTKAVLPTQFFKWKTASNAVFYNLQISTDPAFSNFATNVAAIQDLQYKPDAIEMGRITHYWRVAAFGAGGQSQYSQVWRFRTAIQAPTLLLPAAAAQNQGRYPKLSWSAVPNALMYHVQVSASFGFGTNILDTLIPDTSAQLANLLPSKRYWWHVSAKDEDSEGLFSDARNFQTNAETSVGDDNKEQTLSFAPSPSSGLLRVQGSIVSANNLVFTIYDVNGRFIKRIDNLQLQGLNGVVTIDCAELRNGTYLLEVQADERRQSGRFVIRH